MRDKLQMMFPINDWEYVIGGSITGDGDAFLTIDICCPSDCDREHCDDGGCELESRDEQCVAEVLGLYEEAVVDVLKYAKYRLGIS